MARLPQHCAHPYPHTDTDCSAHTQTHSVHRRTPADRAACSGRVTDRSGGASCNARRCLIVLAALSALRTGRPNGRRPLAVSAPPRRRRGSCDTASGGMHQPRKEQGAPAGRPRRRSDRQASEPRRERKITMHVVERRQNASRRHAASIMQMTPSFQPNPFQKANQ